MDTSYPKMTSSTKRTIYVIAVVAIVIPILLTYILVYPVNFPTNRSTSQSSVVSSSSTSAGARITIPTGIGNDKNLNFMPNSLTVAPGTIITFVNQDASIHDIDFTGMPPGVTIANSPSTNTNKWTGNSYTFTLTTPGVYTFICDYHNWMTGTITVT